MHVRCPHCHQPVELVNNAGLENIDCPSCGSHFSLLGEETVDLRTDAIRSIGHFELVEKLGMGQFGTVWRARDTELDRTVAIKIPRQEQLSPADAEMFLREARAAAQLQHPNIVSVHEVGRERDTVYIVSDLVRGVTLADRLTAGRMPRREAAQLCLAIAEALHHAHQTGVIHRDLKPSNIMLDADGQPRLMDFGLAKRESAEITMTLDGRIMGTPAYMSPEQARGEAHQADARSDIYSLGTILFELLTGELPFRGNKQMLMMQIIHDEPPSPRKLDASVPRDLETICLKCLEKSPDRRYATAREVADELVRFLDGKPVRARPVGRIEHGWRWCKRNPVVAILSVAAAILLMATAAISTVAYFREAALGVELANQSQVLQTKSNDLAEKTTALSAALKNANAAELRQREQTLAATIAEARATRFSGRVGQRFDTLEAIRKATQLARELGKPAAVFDELRDLAVAALALPDIREKAKVWDGWPEGSFSIDFDPLALRLYARSDQHGNVTVRELDDDKEVARLAGTGNPRAVIFGVDGKSLLLHDPKGGALERWAIGDADTTKVATIAPQICCWQQSRDGRRLLAVREKPVQAAEVIDLPSGRLCVQHGLNVALQGYPPGRWAALSPDGRWLAVVSASWREVLLFDVNSGEAMGSLAHQEIVVSPIWHPDSCTLAVGGIMSDNVYLWDVPSARVINTLHEQKGGEPILAMSPSGQLLTSVSDWAGGQVFWHPHLGKLLLRNPFRYDLTSTVTDGRQFRWSIDKSSVTLHVAEPSPVFRILVPDPAGPPRPHAGMISVHRDGQLAAFGHRDGVAIFDLPSGLFLGQIDLGPTLHHGYDTVQFVSSTGDLITYGPDGLYRWPVRFTDSSPQTIVIGPEHFLGKWTSGAAFEASRDGGVIAIADFSRAAVLRTKDGDVKRLGPFVDCRGVAISPDGRWIFASLQHGASSGTLWDSQSAQQLAKVDGSPGIFSPDGQWLWSHRTRYKVETGEKAPPLPTPEGPGVMAFSPDGRTFAGPVDDESVAIVDAVSGKTLVQLSSPWQSRCAQATFSPDGSQLLWQDWDLKSVFAWDLRVLRQNLAEFDLDWDSPPLSPAADEQRLRLPPVLEVQRIKSNKVTDLIDAFKGPDDRAFFAAYNALDNLLASTDAATREMAGVFLAGRQTIVVDPDAVSLLDEAAKKDVISAAQLLLHIAHACRTVRTFKRGHVVVGHITVVDGKTDVELVLAQMPIMSSGYFAGEVADFTRPIWFRAQGYQAVDVPLEGKQGDVVSVGEVRLKPLPAAEQAMLRGKVQLDVEGLPAAVKVQVNLRVGPINTPHNGYSPRGRWPAPITAAVNEHGEFVVEGLSPGDYFVQLGADKHVEVTHMVTLKPGERLDLGLCRLLSTDIGHYIGKAAPIANELNWEKDFTTAAQRARQEKKPIMVMMTATWCGPCKSFEAETLGDPWVRYFLSQFIVVKAYEDKEVEARYGLVGYPTLVFTDSEGKKAHKSIGNKPVLPFCAECAQAIDALKLAMPPELTVLIDKKVIEFKPSIMAPPVP